MKVVHVITRFIRGGADENTLLTCNGQVSRGYQVHLVVGRDHHPDMIAKLDPAVRLHVIDALVRPVAPLQDVRCLLALRRLIRAEAPDIVHTHESKAGILGRLAAAMAGTPTIVHGVHILPFLGVGRAKAMLFLALERLAARYTDYYVDVSTGMRDVCLENGLGTPDNHIIAPSGMDTARFSQARVDDVAAVLGDARLLPSPDVSPVRILIAGALEPRKQVAELIGALAERQAEPSWRLMVVGDGPERANLESLANRLSLQDRVAFLGHRGDLEKVIATADICVHAATNEGLPRVVIQYVLGGRPVVASRLTGMERLVTDGVNGQLVAPGNPDAIVDAVMTLVADPAARKAYADASRRVDLRAWDIDTMLDHIDDAYRRARAPEPPELAAAQ